MADQIYYIKQSDINDNNILFNYIYPNLEHNYYFSDDLSPAFYIELAHKGFITVSQSFEEKFILLPEIQLEYAVLDFKDLHVSKKVKQLINNNSDYIFSIDDDIEHTVDQLNRYHNDCWLDDSYKKILFNIIEFDHQTIDFELLCCKITDKSTKEIVAAEIGYKIGSTYTSLSGFSSKEKRYNNYGKLQMTLLAKYLEEKNFDFWNLGHPYMDYKLNLGAKVLKREDFLQRWLKSVDKTTYSFKGSGLPKRKP
ncbi:MAG: hypothetical protein U9Q33_01070 [Campylobacterota bacterium]|nr:hypothetical protein [Campylobacterota bacterium]